MEQGLYDLVFDGLKVRVADVRFVLQKRFAKTIPFRMEKLTDAKLIEVYDKMKEQNWYDALDKFGLEKVDAFRRRVEDLKIKKMGGVI